VKIGAGICRWTAPPGPRNKWWVVGMLWFICFFNYADRMAINAVSTVLKDEYHFNNEQFGLIASAFMYVYALSAPLAGRLGDKFPRKASFSRTVCVERGHRGDGVLPPAWEFIFCAGPPRGWARRFYFPRPCPSSATITQSERVPLAMACTRRASMPARSAAPRWPAFWAGKVWMAVSFMVFRNRRRDAGRRPGDFPARAGPQRGGAPRDGRDPDMPNPPTIPMWQFLKELTRTPSALLLIAAFFGANSVGLVFHHLDAELSQRAFQHVAGDGRLQRDFLSAGGQRDWLDHGRGAGPTRLENTLPAAGF